MSQKPDKFHPSTTKTKTGIGTVNKLPFIKLALISGAVSLLNILGVLLMQKNLPDEAPLFYGLAEGQEQLTTSQGLLIPGFVSFAITFVNIALSLILSDKFLKQSLIVASLIVNAFLTITTVKIILLVGSF